MKQVFITLFFCTIVTLTLFAQCVDGDCVNGKGVLIDRDNNMLAGEFINGKLTGQGTCHYKWGAKYIGEWANGSFEGQGIYFHADGKIEKGAWKDGLIDKAEENPIVVQPKVRAIIVGISDYQSDQRLNYSVSDANLLHQHLTSPSSNIIQTEFLKNENATIANLDATIKSIANVAKSDETLLFFFFGAYQETSIKLVDGLLTMTDLQEKLSTITAKKMTLLDLSLLKEGDVYMASKSKGTLTKSDNYIVALKKDDESSIEKDGLRQGTFNYFLMQGLRGAADKDLDGNLSASEIYTYVNRKTKAYSSDHLAPELLSDTLSEIVIPTQNPIQK